MEKVRLKYLETHVVNHCNLNCKGCSHFSPFSPPVFVDKNYFEKQLQRLSSLIDIKLFRLLGGEPLLHPDVVDFLNISRKYFKKSIIHIVTNGLLLDKQPEIFWQSCKMNNIIIDLSLYPINAKLDKIRSITNKYDVKLKVSKFKNFFKLVNLEGNADPKKSFHHCRALGYDCPMLYDGKLSNCWYPPTVHLFNKKFKQNIPVSENDFINIFSDISGKEIKNYLSNPTPICKWCSEIFLYSPWSAPAKGDISEWCAEQKPSIYQRIFQTLKGLKHEIKTRCSFILPPS